MNAARIDARPGPPVPESRAQPGTRPLGGGGLVHVPDPLPDPSPFLVLLHGAGSSGAAVLEPLLAAAPELPAVVLAPDSRASTWDVIHGGYGPDVRALDATLAALFARIAVDPERVVLGGFSDGASYALSLGVSNGDLFRRILAFSPGFVAPGGRAGRPAVFVTHGVHDRVLPIDRCSRRVVPALRAAGYDVRYEEFDGGHEVPPPLVREAFAWATA